MKGIPGFKQHYAARGRNLLEQILRGWMEHHGAVGNSYCEIDIDEFESTLRYVRQPKREEGEVWAEAVSCAFRMNHPVAARVIEEMGYSKSLALRRLVHFIFALRDFWTDPNTGEHSAFPLSSYQVARSLKMPTKEPDRIVRTFLSRLSHDGVIVQVEKGRRGPGGTGKASTWRVLYGEFPN